tara:strand:+ start:32 stop:550 length:519 start_codon:yes stop_codon:yes gene_type:complete
MDMPTGLKTTSSPIAVSFSVQEAGPGVFTQGRVDLQLNPLDQEVFVVTAINLDPAVPDAIAGSNTSVFASLTTTSQTAVQNLSTNACLATAVIDIRAQGFVDGGVGFTRSSQDTPDTNLEYIGIIATNDFFLQIQGTNNAAGKILTGRLFGYRAKASSSIYAALVQSEVLSS